MKGAVKEPLWRRNSYSMIILNKYKVAVGLK